MFPNPDEQPTLRIDDVAKLLGISRSSAYEGVATGEIPSIQIGRRKLVPTAALRRMVGLDGAA